MITSLSLRNFKSWEELDGVRMAPITALFGSNSSGKSSILQLLLLMKQTIESSDRGLVLELGGEHSPVSLGSFSELIYDHLEDRSLEFGIHWQPLKPFVAQDPERASATLFRSSALRFDAAIAYDGREMRTTHMEYGANGQSFRMHRKSGTSRKYVLDATGFEFKRTQGRPWDLPAPAKFYGFPDQVRGYYQNTAFLSDLELELETLFRNVYYLGPLREHPHRQYIWSGAQPEDVGERGERSIDALLASAARNILISRGKGRKRFGVQEYAAYWLKELDLVSHFAVEPVAPDSNLYRAWVQQDPSGPRVLVTDVGFGVSQILPVIVLCYYVPEGSIVILEQPEIHLHPSVQAGLADVFVDAVKHKKIQIIFESHSEHLLGRLQLRMAQEEIVPKDIALYFAKRSARGSALTELDVDLFGNITNWPPDFFGDPLGDAAARVAEQAKRMAAAQ